MNLSNWNILHHGHCNSRLLSVIFCYFCRYLQLLRLLLRYKISKHALGSALDSLEMKDPISFA